LNQYFSRFLHLGRKQWKILFIEKIIPQVEGIFLASHHIITTSLTSSQSSSQSSSQHHHHIITTSHVISTSSQSSSTSSHHHTSAPLSSQSSPQSSSHHQISLHSIITSSQITSSHVHLSLHHLLTSSIITSLPHPPFTPIHHIIQSSKMKFFSAGGFPPHSLGGVGTPWLKFSCENYYLKRYFRAHASGLEKFLGRGSNKIRGGWF